MSVGGLKDLINWLELGPPCSFKGLRKLQTAHTQKGTGQWKMHSFLTTLSQHLIRAKMWSLLTTLTQHQNFAQNLSIRRVDKKSDIFFVAGFPKPPQKVI